MTHLDFAMASLLNGMCQGVVVGVAVWLALKLVPRLNPATRFAILGVALFAVAALSMRPFSGEMVLAGTPTGSTATSSTPATPVIAVRASETRRPQLKNQTSEKSQFAFIPQSRSEEWLGRLAEFTPPKELQRAAVSMTSSTAAKTDVEEPLIRIRSGRLLIALATIWAVLSLGMLMRLAAGYRRLRQLKSHATPASDELLTRLWALQAMNGIGRRTRLLVSREIVAPISLGFLDAAVLIPEGFANSLSEAEVEHVLLHELAHLERRDDWTNLAQKFIEAVVPIQPAIHWISSRMGLEREMACDDWVIAAVGTAKSYAASLTKVAELSQCAYEGLLAAGVSGNRSQLFRRVHRMLQRNAESTPKLALGPLGLSAALVVTGIFIGARAPQMIAFAQEAPAAPRAPQSPASPEAATMPVAPLNRAARSAAEATVSASVRVASSAPQVVGSPMAPVSPEVPVSPVSASAPLAQLSVTRNAAVSSVPAQPLAPVSPAAPQSGESHMEMTVRNGWNSMTVKADGAIEFTDDDRDIKSLSPNGHFRLEEGTWLSGRVYEVKADSAGNLTKTYFVRGTVKPLDDEGRAWLARLLPEVIRESGIGADRRVARILRQGGPQAVMTEIGLIHSDGSKRIYIEQLFAQATLNPSQLKDAAGLIKGISSDGDKAQVLVTVDKNYLTGDLRQFLFDTSGSISSDGDKRRVLIDIVQKDPANMETLVGAAAVAKHISSDGDKAEVLIEIGNSYRASDQLRAAYFDAADSISSDGDHARVLVKLLAAHGNDRDTMARALRSGERISSDGDKAAVLKEAVAQYSEDSAVQGAFFDAANSISSDGDHQQVLVTLVHRQGIGAATLGVIAKSAGRISSDGDKARVLVELGEQNVEPVRDAFFAAADSIHSDGDRSRVLIALLDKPGTSSDMAIAAIQSATGMSSDGDKGRVLLDAANRYSKDPGVNAALRKAVSSLHSDGEYRAVMTEIAKRDGSS